MSERRLVDATEVCEFPHGETSGTDEMIQEWIYEKLPEDIAFEHEAELKALCWQVIDGMVHVIDTSETIDPETLPIVRELREKLERYEKAEKEGRLIEFPCREIFESQGGYLYMIYDGEVIELTSCNAQIDPSGVVYVTCCADDKIFPYVEPYVEPDTEPSCTEFIDFEISDFGKNVFLTREAAEEAKLKEMGNNIEC